MKSARESDISQMDLVATANYLGCLDNLFRWGGCGAIAPCVIRLYAYENIYTIPLAVVPYCRCTEVHLLRVVKRIQQKCLIDLTESCTQYLLLEEFETLYSWRG